MKYKLSIGFFFLSAFFSGMPEPALAQGFDKAAFYNSMSSGTMDRINEALETVRSATFADKDAYEGALLMRKAGLLKRPEEKLKAFRSGRIKFEKAMQQDGDNGEYRFLRLTIQEHAPRVVKYYHEQEKDKQFIQKTYKNLPPVVQKAILEYSKTSRVLRQEDL